MVYIPCCGDIVYEGISRSTVNGGRENMIEILNYKVGYNKDLLSIEHLVLGRGVHYIKGISGCG